MWIATMTTNGRVTVPQGLREAMGLRPGMQVEFVRNAEGDYVLQPLEPEGEPGPRS